jgi:plasmid replication initiation protein
MPFPTDPADLLDSSLRTAFLNLVKARRVARRVGAENSDFTFVADATLYAIHAGWLHGPRATRQLRALAAGVTRLTATRRGR